MSGFKPIAVLLSVAAAVFAPRANGQVLPPDMPPGTNGPLQIFQFYDDDWYAGHFGQYAPRSFTNIDNIPITNAPLAALQVDSTDPAWLQYNVFEADGHTNLAVQNGSLVMWVMGNWTSTNLGGTGLQAPACLFLAGGMSATNPSGYWGITLSADGGTLVFSGANSNQSATYLTAPVPITQTNWTLLALTYSPSNTALYTNGILAGTGSGVSVFPSDDVLSEYGLFLGSDETGNAQAHGQILDMETYGYVLSANAISNTYVGLTTWLHSTNTPGNTPGNSPPNTDAPFSLEIKGTQTANQLILTLDDGSAPYWYVILEKENLTDLHSTYVTILPGPGQVSTVVLKNGQASGFFRGIRADVDSDGDGIPDWWTVANFGHRTGSASDQSRAQDDPDGDGISNLQEYLGGTDPHNADTVTLFVASPRGTSNLP
jgi:hypothetical protein